MGEYKIECIVKDIRMDNELHFTFDPTSKYQVEFNGKKICIAVNDAKEEIVSVPKMHLSDKTLDSTVDIEMLKILCVTGKPVVLTVKVEGDMKMSIIGLK